jgi:hypothetical protein
MDLDPEGFVENVADKSGLLKRRAKTDLKRSRSSSNAVVARPAPGEGTSTGQSRNRVTRQDRPHHGMVFFLSGRSHNAISVDLEEAFTTAVRVGLPRGGRLPPGAQCLSSPQAFAAPQPRTDLCLVWRNDRRRHSHAAETTKPSAPWKWSLGPHGLMSRTDGRGHVRFRCQAFGDEETVKDVVQSEDGTTEGPLCLGVLQAEQWRES